MPSRKFVGNWPFCRWPFWYGELKCCWWPPTRGAKGHFESLGIQQEKIYIPFLYMYTYIYIYTWLYIYNKLPFPPAHSHPASSLKPSNPWGPPHPKAPTICPSPGAGDCGLTATCRNLITGFPKREHYPEGQIFWGWMGDFRWIGEKVGKPRFFLKFPGRRSLKSTWPTSYPS